MLLRNKLSLIALFFFLLAACGLVLALNYQNERQVQTFGLNASSAQDSLFEKVLDGALSQLGERGVDILSHPNLMADLRQGDDEVLLADLRAQFEKLSQDHGIDRLELYKNDGSIFYSSQKSYFPPRSLTKSHVEALFTGLDKLPRGLVIDSERNSLLAYPVRLDGANLLVLSLDVDHLLEEFQTLSRSDSYLINRRGRLLGGEGALEWEKLSALINLDLENPLQTIELDQRAYSVTISLAKGTFYDVGYLVSLRDVTANERALDQIKWLTYIVIALFLGGAAFLLWLYLRHALNPLGEAIDVLGALAQKDFSKRLNIRPGKDEVSLIGQAITRFHSDLLRLERMKKARDNRGKRQSMIIRRELSHLAETLDLDARKAVLEDLAEIESQLSGDKGDGDLQSANELAAMALTLRRLRVRIEDQHGELAKTITELEEALKSKTAYLALQQELSTAARVQQSMLPDPIPATDYVHISGTMCAAKEVGGDFYDFFYLDEDRIGVVIADVSGKGIPASLFMAITRSVLRATAPLFESPAACIQALNDELCDNNKEELFVTVFYGIYNLREQSFTYTNAGHGPAYLIRDQKVEALPLTGDVALGVMDGLDYSQGEVQLIEGDTLFFYTDGITEAMNVADEEFGSPALEAVLAAYGHKDVDSLQAHVVQAVEAFVGEAPQFDDITSTALKVKAAKTV